MIMDDTVTPALGCLDNEQNVFTVVYKVNETSHNH